MSHQATLRFSVRPRAIALGLALAFASTAALALGTDAQRAACTPDVFRLCSSDIPNVDKIVACLKAKKASLSPACQDVFNTPASRSVSAGDDDWCAFQNDLDSAQKDWRGWCGPAGRKQ